MGMETRSPTMARLLFVMEQEVTIEYRRLLRLVDVQMGALEVPNGKFG